MAAGSVSKDLARALDIVIGALDIAGERVTSPKPPRFVEARGYTDFLLSISDEELGRSEAQGFVQRVREIAGAPRSLVELAQGVLEIEAMVGEIEDVDTLALDRPRSVGERKKQQLSVLLGAVRGLAGKAKRIVDVGAGSGHFTRLAAEAFDRDALGLEREEARVRVAEKLAEGTRATFAVVDALKEPLALSPGDLAVGLHACGALGDGLVVAAAEAPCDLVLVSCCAQKIREPERAPLSREARARGFVLPREVLGLSNLSSRPVGVEASLGEMLGARQNRYALSRLLRSRGLAVEAGEEMRGINRRRALAGFCDLARRALQARGMPEASEAELREHEEAAAIEFARMRRFSLPRSMLARALEITIVLDRAARLEEEGHIARVVSAFDAQVSPRNLALFASP